MPDAKPEHQYVISFFELSYNEWTLILQRLYFLIPTLGPSNTARVYHARQVTNCGSSSSVCILGFDIPNNVFGEETLQSSELKVYWKPKLSIKRAHGSFRVSVHDVLKLQKPHMTMVVDTKVCFIQKKLSRF